MLYEAVTKAFLDYCAQPHRFNVERGVPLHLFLLMASRYDMLNLLRGEARRKAHEEEAGHLYAISAVELDPVVGNLLQKEENEQRHQLEDEMMSLLQDPRDRQILALRLKGERRTEAFAEILGISHLPIEAQRREVKRTKDRIDKILRRHGGRPCRIPDMSGCWTMRHSVRRPAPTISDGFSHGISSGSASQRPNLPHA
jgi:RNA polymerase sigma-70 factor, ECF subfamily